MLLCLKYFGIIKIYEQVRKLVVSKILDSCSQVNVAKDLKIHETCVCYIFQNYLKMGEVANAKRKQQKSKNGCQQQIIKRIQWCISYLSFNAAQCKKVIFTDECSIERYSSSSTLVRRLINDRFHSKYTLKTFKYGGFSVMVWGSIKADGTRTLIRCQYILISLKYQSVLSKGLLTVCNYNDIFIQDSAPCHRSASTQKYLDLKFVCVMSDWAPQSPDLNIIENMWSILKGQVWKRYSRNANELWAIVKDEQNSIPKETVEQLYGPSLID